MRTLESLRPLVSRAPAAFGSLLLAAELAESPPQEIAIVGAPDDPATGALLSVVRSRMRVSPVVQVAPADRASSLALLAGKTARDGKPTAYVCRNYACQEPTTDPEELARRLGD
jgi:hypothetical protein